MTQLDVLARRQHGCLHRQQVLNVISRYAFNRRLERGSYLRVQPDVVRLAAHEQSATGRAWAAFLSVGPPAAIAGVSAAVLHGIPGVNDSGEVTLAVPATRRASCGSGLIVQRVRGWPERSWTTRGGLPVASLADTMIDLATILPAGRTYAILEQLLWRRLTPEQLASRLSRGRPGSAVIRRELAQLSDGHRSVQERRVALGMRQRRMPAFASNQVLRDERGSPVAEVDFLWRALRVAVQIDGWRYHVQGTFQHDHDVSTTLVVDSDYVVLRFTGSDVEHRLSWVLGRIETVLRRQAALGRTNSG